MPLKNSFKLFPFILLLVILIVPTAEAGVVDWWCDNVGWFCEGVPEEIIDSSGMIFMPQPNGVVTINDGRYIAFGLKGTINGINYTYTSMDYEWEWTVVENNNDIILSATNNDPQIIWEQYFYFYESKTRPMKIEHYLKNNLAQDITNTQMFYLMTVEANDTIEYNESKYLMSNVMPLNIKKNLSGVDAVINFNNQYGFHFDDIIRTGFEINQFYAGDAGFLGYPNLNITAIGFTKNNGLFPAGAEIWIDPVFATSDVEGIHMTPLNSTTFATSYCEENSGQSRYRVYSVNGTEILGITNAHSAADCIAVGYEVSIAAFNETTFVVAGLDTANQDVTYSIKDIAGNNIVGPLDISTSGITTGSGVHVEMLNSTTFVIAWIDDLATDVKFNIVDVNGATTLAGDITVDADAGGSAFGVSVGAFNETTFVVYWKDDDLIGAEAQVFTDDGANTTDIIVVDSNLGGNGLVSRVTVLDETTFVTAVHDDIGSNVSFMVYDVNGSVKVDRTQVDSAVGAGNSKASGLDAINKTAFVIFWYDEADLDFTFAVYSIDGTLLTGPIDIEESSSPGFPYTTAATSFEYAMNTGICNDNFILAYANTSSQSIWQGYKPDGTEWDGNCTVAGGAPADTVFPNVTINTPLNFTFNTSIINFNITAIDDIGISACSYSLNSIANVSMFNSTANDWNSTNTTMGEGSHSVNYYCNDTSGNVNDSISNSFFIDSIQPLVQFIDPTPEGGSSQLANSFTANYTTSDTNGIYSLLELDNDIMGWWDFEVNGSGSVMDKSIYGNACATNGDVSQTQYGKFGKSFNFPGTADWLNCSNGGSLAFANEDFSISAWVNTTSNSIWQLVVFKGNQATGPSVKFGIYGTAYTPIVVLEDADEIIQLEANRTIADSTWNHIVFTKNATNMVIYVNGLNSGNISVATIGTLVDPGDFSIGAHPDDTSWFFGNIDELIVFNRTLDDNDIQGLYNGTRFSKEVTGLSNEAHTITGYAVDIAGNLNSTTRSITVLDPKNTSLRHIDFTLNETIFNSASYVQIANISFNLTEASVLNIVKGVGQLRKFDNAASSTVSMRLTINDIQLFDSSVRTVSDLNDRGVFNIPLNSTTAQIGSNQLVIEVKDSGSGSINLSSFELHLDTNRTNNATSVVSDIQRVDKSFSSTSFVQLANFTFDKTSFNTSTLVDVVHTFVKTSGALATLPRCYLKNNVTDEVTPTYYRYLSGTTDIGSSGISYRSKVKTTDIETWELFCSSDDTDSINSNVTFYALEMGDDNANEIQGFQNESQYTGLTGSNNLLLTATHTFRDSEQIEFAATIIMQSTSGAQEGDDSPLFFINSTEAPETQCMSGYQRSLSNNNDVGTAKLYLDCLALTPFANHTFNLYVDVASGETLDILNVSLAGYESTTINVSQGLVATSITITSPIGNASVSGNVSITASINDPSNLGWFSNVSLQFPNGTKVLDVINETSQFNTTETSFNSSQLEDGAYLINWTIYNSFALAQAMSNFTVVNTAPFIEDIQIWIEEILIANILDFTL